MNTITIKIEGVAGCGKTAIANLLMQVLHHEGFRIGFTDEEELRMVKGATSHLGDRLKASLGNPIVIETVTTGKPTKTDDSGAAFPWSYMDKDSMGQEVTREQGSGMSLRDYFAAAALQGICSNIHCTPSVTYKEVAIGTYEQADAMLQARKEGNQP